MEKQEQQVPGIEKKGRKEVRGEWEVGKVK